MRKNEISNNKPKINYKEGTDEKENKRNFLYFFYNQSSYSIYSD